MKPTTNRLLVKVQIVEVPKTKEGDVPSPIRANVTLTADVVKVGPEVKTIKVKDVVHFSPYGFDEVFVGDDKFVIISEDLILAVNE